MNPQDFLYSTPTLNDTIPSRLSTEVPGDNCYRMHEDDWRQFEFVSWVFRSELADEIAEIDRIWQDQSVPLGEGHAFRAIHVRRAIPTPLDFPFSVAELETIFGKKVSPFSIIGYDKVLADVQSVRLENLLIYATISNGRITTLGFEPLDRFTMADDVAGRLEKIVMTHDLRLVHWRSRTLFKTPEDAMNYLRGNRK